MFFKRTISEIRRSQNSQSSYSSSQSQKQKKRKRKEDEVISLLSDEEYPFSTSQETPPPKKAREIQNQPSVQESQELLSPDEKDDRKKVSPEKESLIDPD